MTDTLNLAQGVLGTGGISFVGDSETGLYRGGIDTMYLRAGTGQTILTSTDLRLGTATGSRGASGFASGGTHLLWFVDTDDEIAKFESNDANASIVIEDNSSTNNGNQIGVIGDKMTVSYCWI